MASFTQSVSALAAPQRRAVVTRRAAARACAAPEAAPEAPAAPPAVVYYTNAAGARVKATPEEVRPRSAAQRSASLSWPSLPAPHPPRRLTRRPPPARPQYAAANAAGATYKASSLTGLRVPLANAPGVSLADAMAFSGAAPELINGRLSMVAIVAALAAESQQHESVVRQLAEQPTGVALLAVLVAAGSLVPLLEGLKLGATGFWSSAAEQMNGRAASARPAARTCCAQSAAGTEPTKREADACTAVALSPAQ
jgi:hypothetical protein